MTSEPPFELSTRRLRLRAWRESDRDPFSVINRDPEVMEHFPALLSREESDGFVDRNIAGQERSGFCFWALEVAETGEFIGFTGLAEPHFDAHFTPTVEVGWRLARPAWGHGYASEAARAAVVHGFDHLGLDEIVSFTVTGNIRSQRVMARLGMSHDPDDDFDHPMLPAGVPLRRHVLWRLPRSAVVC